MRFAAPGLRSGSTITVSARVPQDALECFAHAACQAAGTPRAPRMPGD